MSRRLLSDGTQVIPLMALQITIFPYHGLSLCVSFLHVAADGPALHHFIRSWASISAGNGLNGPLPSHDRTVVQDPEGLESAYLRHHSEPINFDSETMSQRLSDKVRATFSLSKPQIERLKNWANSQITKSTQFSSFVVTSSVVWVSFIMSRELISGGSGAEDEACCFAFAANCRNERLGYRIPAEYFGNCFAFCLTAVEKSELLGENGLVVAMKAIEKRVGEVKKVTLKDVMAEMSVWKELVERGAALCAAGSPRLGAYDTNFGWGRPIKTEENPGMKMVALKLGWVWVRLIWLALLPRGNKI
ncbi:Coumaroyl-CoA:anthocyanidin 3-O-glucoside-6''-O-coumaroyltransferase 2, partial [Cucurbita argyrosperma subsp. argyrosperma]